MIMDIVLCVLKGFIGMYERGVYGSAVAKEHMYWLSRINGDKINDHFNKVNR